MTEYPIINIPLTQQNIRRLCKIHQTTPRYLMERMRLGEVQTVYKWFSYGLPGIDNLVFLSYLWGIPINDILVVDLVTY